VEEIGVPGENHQPAAGHSQILSDEVVSSTPHQEHKTGFIVIGNFVIIFRKTNQVSDQWPPFPCSYNRWIYIYTLLLYGQCLCGHSLL
jgi:hypothetical protein